MAYDIIGDIHGCAKTLSVLLDKLGYVLESGIYRHPIRQVIFLGDFVDRGPYQQDVINIVRPMVETGAALSVMGNHEYNAIAYATFDEEKDDYLRQNTDKNRRQHQAFLDAYVDKPDQYDDVIAWFKTLPLWLELHGLNIVHACWDKKQMNNIKTHYSHEHLLTDQLLKNATTKGKWEFQAVETLLKGKEVSLPEGGHFHDTDGNIRHNIRVRWWDQNATSYQTAFMGPESVRTHMPDDEITGDHMIEYGHHEPPVFLGHYWMEGKPKPLAPNIACLDYSVAKAGGKLVAYRFDGEQTLSADKYVYVERIE